MNQSKAEEQELDFSIISRENPQQNPFDSSLQSILTEQQQRSSSKNKNTGKTAIENFDSVAEKKDTIVNGSFLKDLQKLQQELSYQSKSFNVYDPSFTQSDVLIPIQKQTSNNVDNKCSKQTNFSKQNQVYEQNGYEHLVIDFTQVGKQQMKQLTFLQKLKLERSQRQKELLYSKSKNKKPNILFSTQSSQRLSFASKKNMRISSIIHQQKFTQERQPRWSISSRGRFYKSVSGQKSQNKANSKHIGVRTLQNNWFPRQKSKQTNILHQYYGSYLEPNKKHKNNIQPKKKSFKICSVQKNILPKVSSNSDIGQMLKFKTIKHKKLNLNSKKRI